MSPNKDWFQFFQELNGKTVLLDNNKACKVAGLRSIVNIIMFDNCDPVLNNVRYVPELRRNLISLGMLDKLGCSVKIENGYIKVIKGAMAIMKGELSNGLYYLVGETIIGTVDVTTNSRGNMASLWHKRFGHVSERGELYK